MKAAPTLPRLNFSNQLQDERQKLAIAAQEKLGYRKLAEAIAIRDALLFALRELNIAPLQDSSVASYKARKAKVGMWNTHKEALVCFMLAPVGWQVARWGAHQPVTSFAGFVCAILGAGVMGTAFIYGIVLLCKQERHRTVWKWERTPLKGYTGNVPEFALDKAIRIQERVPEAHFEIEYLAAQTDRRVVPYPDPFLRVSLKRKTQVPCTEYAGTVSVEHITEAYYIDVWNEREYERTI